MNPRRLGALDKARMRQAARILFLRERIPNEIRLEAVIAYFHGMSYRRVAAFYDHQFSPEAVRYWWNRMSLLFDYLGGPHAVVVADETPIAQGRKSAGKRFMLWVAIDAYSMKAITTRFNRHQYNEDCRDFLWHVRHESRPKQPVVIHDRGPWYKAQAEKIGLAHAMIKGGKRSLIENWNRQLKHRMARFWRSFPANARPEQIHRWLRAYCAVWNLTRRGSASA